MWWKSTEVNGTDPLKVSGSTEIFVPENQMVVGSLSNYPNDEAVLYRYELVAGEGSDSNSWFAIDNAGVVSFQNIHSYEYPVGVNDSNTYAIRVRVTGDGGIFEEKLIINVTDVVEENPTITFAKGTKTVSNQDIIETVTITSVYGVNVSDQGFIDGDTPGSDTDHGSVADFKCVRNSDYSVTCTIKIIASAEIIISAWDIYGNNIESEPMSYIIDVEPLTARITRKNLNEKFITTSNAEFRIAFNKKQIIDTDLASKLRIQSVFAGKTVTGLTKDETITDRAVYDFTVSDMELAGDIVEVFLDANQVSDVAGNKNSASYGDGIDREYWIMSDNVVPQDFVITVNTNSPHSLARPQVTFIPFDAGVGVDKCEISYDNVSWVELSGCANNTEMSHSPVSDLSGSVHSVWVRVADRAGNFIIKKISYPPHINIISSTFNSSNTISGVQIKVSNPTNTNIVIQNVKVTHSNNSNVALNPVDCFDDGGGAVSLLSDYTLATNSHFTCNVGDIQKTGNVTVVVKDGNNQTFSNSQYFTISSEVPRILIFRQEDSLQADYTKRYQKASSATFIIQSNQDLNDTAFSGNAGTYLAIDNIIEGGGESTFTLNSITKLDSRKFKVTVNGLQNRETIKVGLKGDVVVGKNGMLAGEFLATESSTVTVYTQAPVIKKIYSPSLGNLTKESVTLKLSSNHDMENMSCGMNVIDARNCQKTFVENHDEEQGMTVRDLAGNSVVVKYQVTNIDKVAPSISITNTPTDQLSKDPIRVSLSVSDTEILAANVLISGINGATIGPCRCENSSVGNVLCNFEVLTSGGIKITATDTVGNIQSEIVLGYVVDVVVPVVQINSSVPINVANQHAYNLKGTCTAGDGDVTLVINGSSSTVTCGIDGKWSSVHNLSTLSDGGISVQASQTDKVGHLGSSSVNLTKHTELPQIALDKSGLIFISKDKLSKVITGTANKEVSDLNVLLGGYDVGTVYWSDAHPYNWWVDFSDTDLVLPFGLYDLTVIVRDEFGNNANPMFSDKVFWGRKFVDLESDSSNNHALSDILNKAKIRISNEIPYLHLASVHTHKTEESVVGVELLGSLECQLQCVESCDIADVVIEMDRGGRSLNDFRFFVLKESSNLKDITSVLSLSQIGNKIQISLALQNNGSLDTDMSVDYILNNLYVGVIRKEVVSSSVESVSPPAFLAPFMSINSSAGDINNIPPTPTPPPVPTPPTITPPATCQPYILKEIKYQSPKNDPQEVIKLQNFL